MRVLSCPKVRRKSERSWVRTLLDPQGFSQKFQDSQCNFCFIVFSILPTFIFFPPSSLRKKKKEEGITEPKVSLKNRSTTVDVIDEDEVVASFTSVGDADVDSGVEDEEVRRLSLFY